VPLANVLDRPECADELTARRLFSDAEQLRRGATRRGDYDYRRAMQPARDDIRSAADRIRIADGRTTEFDDYHGRAT